MTSDFGDRILAPPIMRLARTYITAVRSFKSDTRLFILGAFLVSVGTNLVWLLFNLYLRALGYPESEIGDTLALRSFGSVLAALPATIVATRGTMRHWLVGASALNAIAFTVVSLSSSLLLLRPSILSIGLFSTVYSVVTAPFLMRTTTPEQRPFAFSLNAALGNVSGVLGSVAGGVSRDVLAVTIGSDLIAYRIALLCGAVFSLASILPFLRLHDGAAESGTRTDIAAASEGSGKAFVPSDVPLFAKLLLPTFLIGLGAGLTIPFINLYFKDVWNLSDSMIGVLYAFGMGFTFLGMAAAPTLVHRFGRVRTIAYAQGASIPFILVLAYLHWLPAVIAAFLARQMLMNMASPVNDQFAMERVRPESGPLVNALKMLAWTSSWVVSAAVGGRIIEHGSYVASFMVTAALYGVATTMFWAFFRRRSAVNQYPH